VTDSVSFQQGLDAGQAASRDFPIINKKGLHARATAKFVQCCEKFDAVIAVTKDGETVGGSSIMGILTLGAGIGSRITVSASGVANRFGEDE